jgi:hypothetical protein
MKLALWSCAIRAAALKSRTFLTLAISCIFLISSAWAQSDRGTVSGAVTDPSGAVIAGAKIDLQNLANGNHFQSVTTSAGTFSVPSVPTGKYTLTVTAAGFKTAKQEGIEVLLDQTASLAVHLEIGQATETISVVANAEILKTDNAELSMNVSGEKLNDLPINFGGGGAAGGGIRNWLSFTYLAPGVSGTSANSEVNGLPGSNFKVYLEGQDSTSFNDTAWTSTVAAASVEAVTQFAVQSSNFSAEYGQAMGAFYNFSTKSGSNQLHGSLYELWANEVLDAAHPFNHLTDRDRKNDYGFSIGGPVYIPKLYNGKNHTFFFFNLERFANNQLSNAATGTVPTAAYRQGDFGCALYATSTNCSGPTVSLTDPTSGYTFLQNQIFDPASTFTDANGRLTRTPFPNNVIPTNRLDPVALKIQALIPAPTNGQTTLNWVPSIVTNTQQQIPSAKIDQNFGSNTKVSLFWTNQSTNQIAAPDGLPIPLTSSRPKIVGGNQWRFNFDRTLSSNMVAHFGAGFYRFHNPDSSPESVLNYDSKGQLGLVGSSTGVGFPAISGLTANNEGGISASGGGFGPTTADHQTTDLASMTGSLSWSHGRHNYKFGFEAKQEMYSDANFQGAQGVYAFNGAQTAPPFLGTTTVGGGGTTGSVGIGYASFLLGAVSSTTVNPPKATELRRITEGLYMLDNFRLTSKLTLEYGVRWDRAPMGHEIWDRQSEIGLNTPNPNAGGIPGGFIFAGYGQGRCNCEFSKTYNFAFQPRLSIAWQLNPKTVLRAGWGVFYSGGDSWAYLNGGYSLNGLGLNSIQSSAASFGLVSSQLSNGIVYNPAQLTALNLNPGVNTTPGQLNTFSSVWGGLYNDPNAGRPARINQWNVALQRQLTKNMTIQAAYVGDRGVWEQANNLVSLNAITPQVLAAHHIDLTNANTRTLMTSTICSTAAVSAGFTLPYSSFPCTATVAQSLRPFPEYNSNLQAEFVGQGNSWYDSLQVSFNHHLSRGLDVTSNFTWAKTLELGTSAINGNPYNRQEQKGLDPASLPFTFVNAITYMTPKLGGSSNLLRTITGGWTIGATLWYASGGLIQAPASQVSKWNTYTFESNVPMMRVPDQPLYLLNPNCKCFDPNNQSQRILNPAAWADVQPGTISPGALYYNDYRGPHGVNENGTIGRTFTIKERVKLSVRAEFFNMFNRVLLPNSSLSSGNPTSVTTVNNATGAISGFGYYSIGRTSNLGGQRNGDLVARITF